MLKAGLEAAAVVDILRMICGVVERKELRSVLEASRDATMMGSSMRMSLKVLLM